MNYNINLGAWNNIFAVPCTVVDEHIKMAGAAQLKVLLYLLRHSGNNNSSEDISKALSLAPADVSDALNYWIETGILQQTNNELVPSEIPSSNEVFRSEALPASSPVSAPAIQEKVILEKSSPTRPTHQECSRILDEREDIRQLVVQAQDILGRTLKRGDIDILVSLPDWTGLSVGVILMVISYCKGIGKKGISYIEKVAISWANNDINTCEKANREIERLSQNIKAWYKVSKILGIPERKPTAKEEQQCHQWIYVWKFSDEMISAAYEKCINATSKVSVHYINKILSSWYEEGIFKVSDIHLNDNKRTAEKSDSQKQKSSYDIAEIEKQLFDSELKDWGE